MKSVIKGIGICAISAGVSDNWKSLEERAKDMGSIDEKTLRKFRKNVGVEGCFVSPKNQTNSDLCYAAAEKMLNEKGIDREKIGVVVYVTQSPDYRMPATAMVLQHRLGISKNCIVFDVNLGCSGFVYGLNIVGSLMLQSEAEYGLLMCGETCTRSIHKTDEESSDTESLIFGDAGSATLLCKDEARMIFLSMSDGDRFRAIIDPWGLYRHPFSQEVRPAMDGISVFNFSTDEVPELINDLMNEMGTTPNDYDFLILHQANKLIMNQIAKKTGFPLEKSLSCIGEIANTSSASIPVTIVQNLAGDGNERVRCIFCGYGVGLSWSAVDCYFKKSDVITLQKTGEFFEDGYK